MMYFALFIFKYRKHYGKRHILEIREVLLLHPINYNIGNVEKTLRLFPEDISLHLFPFVRERKLNKTEIINVENVLQQIAYARISAVKITNGPRYHEMAIYRNVVQHGFPNSEHRNAKLSL